MNRDLANGFSEYLRDRTKGKDTNFSRLEWGNHTKEAQKFAIVPLPHEASLRTHVISSRPQNFSDIVRAVEGHLETTNNRAVHKAGMNWMTTLLAPDRVPIENKLSAIGTLIGDTTTTVFNGVNELTKVASRILITGVMSSDREIRAKSASLAYAQVKGAEGLEVFNRKGTLVPLLAQHLADNPQNALQVANGLTAILNPRELAQFPELTKSLAQRLQTKLMAV